jgi:hypothetical protein
MRSGAVFVGAFVDLSVILFLILGGYFMNGENPE